MSRYNMDVRLAKLGREYTYTKVIAELQDKGININSGDFSRMKNGYSSTPKAELVLAEADKIVSRWEEDRSGKAV